ncbi:hypothetical protein JCM10212_003357 [Sporobolomyces blumeae]
MSITSALLEHAFEDALASIPPGSNPYRFLSDALTELLLPRQPESVIIQLYILAALIALSGVLALASLSLRAWKGVFWVCRFQRNLGLLRPHASISWSLVSVIAIVFLELFIACYVRMFQGRPYSFCGYPIFTVWCSLWCTGFVATWSISSSLIVHLHSRGNDVRRWSKACNVVGIVAPIVYLAVLLPVGFIGGKAYHDVLVAWRKVKDSLESAAQGWSPGQGFSLGEISPALPDLQGMVKNVVKLAKYARIAYILEAVTVAILLVAMVVTGSTYLYILRQTICQNQTWFNRDSLSRHTTDRRVRRTLNSLIATLVAFTFLCVGYFAFAIYGSLNPLALNHTSVASVLALVPLYIFAILGLPCSIILVRGAWDARASDKKIAKSEEKLQMRNATASVGGGVRGLSGDGFRLSAVRNGEVTMGSTRGGGSGARSPGRTRDEAVSRIGVLTSGRFLSPRAGVRDDVGEGSTLGSVMVTVEIDVSEDCEDKVRAGEDEKDDLDV